MRSKLVISAVDSHTEGMPTRVVTGGVGTLPGATMLERRANFERDRDELRTLLMFEPRGHGAMSGAILQPPTRDADVGVLFIEVTEPTTTIHLGTPAGLVLAEVEVADGQRGASRCATSRRSSTARS